ncbi:MAG: delta-aminolevulinic acid dehydratase [Cytophagia bacterium]|nr:delta-aminolevulinic acid dehydratase [Cytophagia bacterium]
MEESGNLSDFKRSFDQLASYCEKEGFKGWDPYDGLNSKVFQATPLKHWDFARLAWIQLFKRNPVNLRKQLLIPKEYNAMGIGLFLTGYSNLYQLAKSGNSAFGKPEVILNRVNELAELLLSLRSEGYSGSCWGYNFDWQARRLFFFPKYTPTVVATCFGASALFKAFEATQNQKYLDSALDSANFIIKDLNRTEHNGDFLFSYSPLKGNNTVFNASLLGSKILSQCYRFNNNEAYIDLARRSIKACVNSQGQDGSWVYGLLPIQNWIDSFHTGFNLDAIKVYSDISGDNAFDEAMTKGLTFYFDNFFESDGRPKYFHDRVFPIDIHCPGQLFVVVDQFDQYQKRKELVEKVLSWTITNMQDKDGFFYYQMKKPLSSKIPYMRWSQAFMFYGMSHYFNSINSCIHQNE